MKPIRILLVDDHKIIRQGICALLRHDKNLLIVGEAQNGKEALDLVGSKHPDVLLMDIDMPELSGTEATKIINRNHPEIKVLALTMHDDPNYIKSLLAAGAMGYISKSSGSKEVREAIYTTHKGESYFSAGISDTVLHSIMKQKPASYRTTVNLTSRELEILKLISLGLTNLQIANKLSISKRTVDTHRQNLLEKLNLNNTASLVRYAMEHNLVT
jgi:two-component system nitrate/nitrite response regulator NarL